MAQFWEKKRYHFHDLERIAFIFYADTFKPMTERQMDSVQQQNH